MNDINADFKWEGAVFNRLTVISRSEDKVFANGGRKIRVVAECSCGVIKTYYLSALKTGNTKSCGCYNLERISSHGMYGTRQYQIWADMKNRCNDKSHEGYGEKGVTYQESWGDFQSFWSDMEEGYSEELTIERIDPSGNYTKENCKWATKKEQTRNRGKYSNNKTGTTGVVALKSKNGDIFSYRGTAQGLDGKSISKQFSINKFGKDGAYELACKYSESVMEELNKLGANYSETHGQ